MKYLLDTSVLVRIANKSDKQHQEAMHALEKLHGMGATVCICSQVLIEFRAVATRPRDSNGLGLPNNSVVQLTNHFIDLFLWIEDSDSIFQTWKKLTEKLDVQGKQVHDARLAATCAVSSCTHFLTFNTRHFFRFAEELGPLKIESPSTFPIISD